MQNKEFPLACAAHTLYRVFRELREIFAKTECFEGDGNKFVLFLV